MAAAKKTNGNGTVMLVLRVLGIVVVLALASLGLAYAYGILDNRVENLETDFDKLGDIKTDIALIQKDVERVREDIAEIKKHFNDEVVAVDGLADRSE